MTLKLLKADSYAMMQSEQRHHMGKSISIIIPTYNERENIMPLVERIHHALAPRDYEAVFVDDNSRDGTAELINSMSGKYPVRALVRKDERGLATAVIHGIEHSEGDIIVVMDADLQHPPEVIPDLLSKVESGADMAIASRYVAGGGMKEWGLTRRIISKGAIVLAHLLLPTIRKVKDPMSGFFAFKRQALGKARLSPRGYKILLEILIVGKFQNAAEVPFTFESRSLGQSKLNAREQIEYLKHLFILMWRTGELWRFIKFCLVGLSGVIVNYGLYWLLTRLAGFTPLDNAAIGGIASGNAAMAISIETSIVTNFILNNYITFADRNVRGIKSFLGRLLKFNLICLVGGLLQIGIANLLTITLGIYDLISVLIAIVVAMLWNYLLNTWITWR
jgi:dolichol-phosphate mannosyltransferase